MPLYGPGVGGSVCTCSLRVVDRAAGHFAGGAAVGIVMYLPAGPGERRNAAHMTQFVLPRSLKDGNFLN